MAMRRSTRRELAKLRELVSFFVEGKTCWFCRLPLAPAEWQQASRRKHGTGSGVPLAEMVTIHHLRYGEGGEWNTPEGRDVSRRWKRLAHQRCHRRFEGRRIRAYQLKQQKEAGR